MKLFLQSLALSALLLHLAGCGGVGSRGSLSGKVTLDDQPVTKGSVLFNNSASGESEMATIQSDGTYKSTNVPLGDVRIAVLVPSGAAKMPAGAKLPPGIPADHPQAKMYAEAAEPGFNVPKEYSDPATSNLTVKVEGGAQEYNIPLKSKK